MKSENKKITHRFLGEVVICEGCIALNQANPDTTTTFVNHDGEIKEVTSKLLTENN